MRVRSVSIAIILGLSIPSIARAEDVATRPYQSRAAFETAIGNRSTSPYVVLITVIDDRTGKSQTGCTLAPFVVGALYREKWGAAENQTAAETNARYEEARKIALENTSHIFHFSSEAALNNVVLEYPEACRAIEQGKTARIADRSGQLLIGPFVEGPAVNLRSCPPPTYPSDEKINDEGGTGISLLIGPDGSVLESKVTESSGSARRDEAIRAALSACKVKPKTIDGEPVPEPTILTIQMGNRAHWARPR
jgi:TonB family protein